MFFLSVHGSGRQGVNQPAVNDNPFKRNYLNMNNQENLRAIFCIISFFSELKKQFLQSNKSQSGFGSKK